MIFSEDSTLFSFLERFEDENELTEAILKYIGGNQLCEIRDIQSTGIQVQALVSLILEQDIINNFLVKSSRPGFGDEEKEIINLSIRKRI